MRLHGCLCLSQGLCHMPASDPAPARGPPGPWLEPSARSPRASGWLSSDPLKLPFFMEPPTEPAASRHAVNATRVHPFSSVTNSLGQAPCQRTNGSSIRDSWKGHLGSGTRLSSPVLEVRTPKLKKANARTWRNRQERVTHDCTSLELVN